jgi:hypothetical protein
MILKFSDTGKLSLKYETLRVTKHRYISWFVINLSLKKHTNRQIIIKIKKQSVKYSRYYH